MTRMAAMPIYGKNPSKISRTGLQISTKLGMKHWWLKYMYYNVDIKLDPVMTLIVFAGKVNMGRLFILNG